MSRRESAWRLYQGDKPTSDEHGENSDGYRDQGVPGHFGLRARPASQQRWGLYDQPPERQERGQTSIAAPREAGGKAEPR